MRAKARLRAIAVTGILLFDAAATFAQVPAFCGDYPQTVGAGDWQASHVFYHGGRLTYVSDGAQNRIPDYSYSGYRYGGRPIPTIPQVTMLTVASGDQTSRIQSALNAAASPGAVVLGPGTWEIRGTLRINRSGIVLRGAGDGTTGTVLRATGDTPHQRPVVVVGTGSTTWTTATTPRTDITTALVPVGALSFDVASTTGFAVGQDVVIHHPSTQAWIDAVDKGGVVNDPPWSSGSANIEYWRRITAISGNRITVDAPIYNHLNRSLSQSFMARVSSSVVTEAGVENLRIDIVTAGGEDENHAWHGVQVIGAQDSWVRGLTILHYGGAGVGLGENALRVTVDNCRAVDPVGIRTGGRFYAFSNNKRTQLCLFTRCTATDARHSFIAGQPNTSGIVFHRGSQRGGGSEGGHAKWSQAVLFDNITELSSGQVLLINRGDFGSSHGWGTAHSTIWKYNSEMLAQKPPTAQNYAFSNAGRFRTSVYFPGPFGVQQIQSGRLVPESLYEAQLCERLGGGTPTPAPTPTPTPTPIVVVTPTPTPTGVVPTNTPTPTSTPTPTPVGSTGYYRLMARHSGKAVVVQGASTADGANVFQWTYGGTNTNDEWQLVDLGTGYHRIVNRHSGKVLEVSGASTANAANVRQWAWGGGTHQQWQVSALGTGYHRLTARHSGRVLNVAGAGTADGANVDQWSWANVAQQQFELIPIP